MIGLSGNSSINRKEVLERAFKSLSMKEQKIIKESDNQNKFKAFYDEKSKASYIDSALPEGGDVSNSVKTII